MMTLSRSRLLATPLGLQKRFQIALLGVLASCGMGCAFGSQKVVQGATFELSGAETVLADRIEAEEPKSVSVEARCRYWNARRVDVSGNNQRLTNAAGVVSIGGYETLRRWVTANESRACGALQEQRRTDAAAREVEIAARREKAAKEAEVEAERRAAAAREAAAAQAEIRRVQAEEKARRHEALKLVVPKVVAWARAQMTVEFKTVTRRAPDRCYNRVDYEVPCDGPAAFKKVTGDVTGETTARITNKSAIDLYCTPNRTLLGGDSAAARVPHASRRDFRTSLGEMDLLFRSFGATSPHLICGAAALDVMKTTKLTEAELAGAGVKDIAKDIIGIAFISGSDQTPVFLANQVAMWTGTDINLVE